MAADQHKGIALVILGIVAVIAIVGLVLLFVESKAPTGEGVYGGAIKQVQYPNWIGRGTPRNVPGVVPGGEVWPSTQSKDLTTHWNYYGAPKRNPYSDIPSAIRKCETGGFLVPYDPDQAGYYAGLGYDVVNTGDQKAGMCVYPDRNMVGGVIGQI